MEGREAAVADAGPLIHLDELGALGLLDTYVRVWVPALVAGEADRHRPGWRDRMPAVVRMTEPAASEIAAVRARLAQRLDPGEIAALALWSAHRDASILCDDLAARQAAVEFGAPVLGTLGLVLRAVRVGRIPATDGMRLVAALPTATSLHIRGGLLAGLLADLRDRLGPSEVREPRVRYRAKKKAGGSGLETHDSRLMTHDFPATPDPRIAELVRRLVLFLEPRRVILFGSRARGDGVAKSDIDLAVDAPGARPKALFAFWDSIEADPPTLLGIDVVLLHEVGAEFRARVEREGRVLYEQRAA